MNSTYAIENIFNLRFFAIRKQYHFFWYNKCDHDSPLGPYALIFNGNNERKVNRSWSKFPKVKILVWNNGTTVCLYCSYENQYDYMEYHKYEITKILRIRGSSTLKLNKLMKKYSYCKWQPTKKLSQSNNEMSIQ